MGEVELGALSPQACIGEQGVRKTTLPAANFFIEGKREGHSKPSLTGWFSTTFIYSGERGGSLPQIFQSPIFLVFLKLGKFKSMLHLEYSRVNIFYHKRGFTAKKFRDFRKFAWNDKGNRL